MPYEHIMARRHSGTANKFAPGGYATRSAVADLLCGEGRGVGRAILSLNATARPITGTPRRRVLWRSPQARIYSLAPMPLAARSCQAVASAFSSMGSPASMSSTTSAWAASKALARPRMSR